MTFTKLTDFDTNFSETELTAMAGRQKVGYASFCIYTLTCAEDIEKCKQRIRFRGEDENLAISGTLRTPAFQRNLTFPISILYIQSFYVYPEFRNQRCGTRMLNHIRSYAKELVANGRLAEAVYIYPNHTQEWADGTTKRISNVAYHGIRTQMERLFQNAGYTQIKDNYKQYARCYCTVEAHE